MKKMMTIKNWKKKFNCGEIIEQKIKTRKIRRRKKEKTYKNNLKKEQESKRKIKMLAFCSQNM